MFDEAVRALRQALVDVDDTSQERVDECPHCRQWMDIHDVVVADSDKLYAVLRQALEALESDPVSHAGLVNRKQAITALRQALSREAVKHIKTWHERCEEHPDHQERIISERMIQARMQEEIDELRQALETNQEPFEYWSVADGWVKIDELREHFDSVGCGTIYKSGGEGRSPLYTAPPKKQWVGLTDEEVSYCRYAATFCDELDTAYMAELIEKALKEKNT